jgi:hypothetical protein
VRVPGRVEEEDERERIDLADDRPAHGRIHRPIARISGLTTEFVAENVIVRASDECSFQHISNRVPARQSSTAPEGRHAMPMGQERTKEQLYSQAKRLSIKGRSKMNKGQLKAALARRGH